VLTARALNRALLARQHLLARTELPARAMIGHLVGMQAQAPLAAYVGLWTRIRDFQPAELAKLTVDREVVRGTLLRGTVHLVTAEDALTLRPLLEPAVTRMFTGSWRRRLAGIDVAAVAAAGRALMAEKPRTRAELRDILGARWPRWDSAAMAHLAGFLVPTVQVTPRGVWGSTGPATLTTLEAWLGRPLEPTPSIDDVVRRYFAAFGPASIADVQAWSGLTRLREVVERLGLRTFRDESGVLLYDVETGPRPDPGTPAPPRFLPEYDNVLLGHADRARVLPPGRRVPLPAGNGAAMGTVLLDGRYEADWQLRTGVLRITPYRALSPAERAELTAEAMRLAGFVAPDSSVDVRFSEPR
jgi:hypothetical protein